TSVSFSTVITPESTTFIRLGSALVALQFFSRILPVAAKYSALVLFLDVQFIASTKLFPPDAIPNPVLLPSLTQSINNILTPAREGLIGLPMAAKPSPRSAPAEPTSQPLSRDIVFLTT